MPIILDPTPVYGGTLANYYQDCVIGGPNAFINTITTLAFVQIGKIYGNLMVDLKCSNSKLWDRGARIISTVTGL